MERKGKPIFDPMPGRIGVKALKEEAMGGIVLVRDASAVMGEVVCIGGDEPDGDEDFPLAVGDVVMFNRNSGIKVSVDEKGIDDGGVPYRVSHSLHFLRTAEIITKVRWPDG